jgi:3-hydroxyacyl-[acyl-carrier-protein] dehydratase
MELNKFDILKIQKNREPYLFIEHITDFELKKFAFGYKNLKNDEWFFKVHWENDPNMPGFLQIEAMTQLCAITILAEKKNHGKVVYLTSADNIKFFSKVLPGDKLIIKTYLKSYKRGIGAGSGECYVRDKKVSSANFSFVFPDDMITINKFNK